MNRTLAIFTSNHVDSFPRTVLSGIQAEAHAQGFEIREHSYVPDPDNPNAITFDLDSVAGILVITNSIPDAVLQTLYQAGKPISLISHQVAYLNIPGVANDNVEGVVELVKHLLNTCRRRAPLFIRGLMTHNDARQRESAFRQELIHHNLSVPESYFLKGDFQEAVAADSVRVFLQQGLAFDSIVAADYLMAIAVIEVLRKANIRVPEDVSVVGFGDSTEAEIAELTVVAANVVDLGICAVKQVVGQIKGVAMSGTTVLGTQLIVRKTSLPQ
jgi:DNA-binding LacI/PurR family transcriptional regulator